MSRFSRALSLIIVSALAACSGADRPSGPGTTSDAGVHSDAGTMDGGPGTDGGSTTDGGTTDGGGTTITQSAFPDAFAAAICARIFECCTLSEAQEAISSSITDEASCRSMESSQAAYGVMVTNANRAHYDAQAGAQCVAFARGAACRAFSVSRPAGSEVCNQLVVGDQMAGSPCASSQECASRLCTGIGLDINGDPAGDGVCQNPAASGHACAISTDPDKFNDGVPCQPGSFESWSGGECTCEALLANTTPCENDSDCASTYCNSNSRCADQSTAALVCTMTP